jgi:hypothetical protein
LRPIRRFTQYAQHEPRIDRVPFGDANGICVGFLWPRRQCVGVGCGGLFVITLENPNSRQQSFERGSIEAQMLAQTETSSIRGWSGSKNGNRLNLEVPHLQ